MWHGGAGVHASLHASLHALRGVEEPSLEVTTTPTRRMGRGSSLRIVIADRHCGSSLRIVIDEASNQGRGQHQSHASRLQRQRGRRTKIESELLQYGDKSEGRASDPAQKDPGERSSHVSAPKLAKASLTKVI